MWHSAAAVLGVATIMSAFEGVLQGASGRMLGVWLGGLIPAIGTVVAWKFGPRLRPRRSYQVGRAFLILASLPISVSVYNWRDTPLAGAVAFHYVLVLLFTAVFFNKREVHEQLVVIGIAHAATLFLDGFTGQKLLTWMMTMFGVIGVGLVISTLVSRMDALSYRDPLTGAHNRRSWDLALLHAVEELPISGGPLSLMLIDIDHFKTVNDTKGHEAGDEVLRRAVSVWRPMVRATDTLARLGGDEFALLLLSCGPEAAEQIGAGLLAAFSSATGVTCSIGIGTVKNGGSPADLYASADRALYVAKHSGRAKVRSSSLTDSTGETTNETARETPLSNTSSM